MGDTPASELSTEHAATPGASAQSSVSAQHVDSATSLAPSPSESAAPVLTKPSDTYAVLSPADLYEPADAPAESLLPIGKGAGAHWATSPALSTPVRIYGVVLVDFDHALGPIVEYSTPASLKEEEELARTLPFLALPDGAHARDEDYSYFHVLAPGVSPSTIFGISCNRQLASSLLVKRSSDVTRSTVQKAIVVLASQPIFGPIRDKLGVITRAFFAQKDFSETGILEEFHKSLETSLLEGGRSSESAMYMGTSIRELIIKFRFKTLMLLKLLMLQRKIMFYGAQVERLCTFQYSLVSLIPTLLTNLDDAAAPSLDDRAKHITRSMELRTSDRASLLKYLGLPLNVFGADAFFQPYLPLQQIDLLQSSRSYLVGTTNSIFQQQRDCQIDVVVNIDTGTLDFHDPKLASLVHLTAADRKWMDELVSTVQDGYNALDPTRSITMKFVGSDDFLRGKFEEYICSALAAIKFSDFLAKGRSAAVLITTEEMSDHLAHYNESWIAALRRSDAFKLWDRHTDSVIFDLVEPRHPCEGQTHLVQDVGIRLVQGVHDLRLDENLAPTKEALKGLAAQGSTLAQSGSESVWKAVSAFRADINKRQAEYKDKREKEKLALASAPPAANGVRPADPSQQFSTQVQAGYAAASTHAASLASGIGSFFASATKPKPPSKGFVPKQLNLSPDPASSPGRPPRPPPVPRKTPSPPLESASTMGSGYVPFWRKTSYGSATSTGSVTPPSSERNPPSAPSARSSASLGDDDRVLVDSKRSSSRLSDVAL